MAQIETSGGGKGKSHQKKMEIRVDFTPMVDMNMLLITFFMLCTTMIKSQTLQISLPTNEKVDKKEQNKVKQSEAITIILDSELNSEAVPVKDFVYPYPGMPVTDADPSGNLIANNMKGIAFEPNKNGAPQGVRAILHDRNKQVIEKINKLKEDWKANKFSANKEANDSIYQLEAKKIRNDSTLTRPVVIIKATPNASFMSLVTALDEMQINSISRYQIDRINTVDSALMIDCKAKGLK